MNLCTTCVYKEPRRPRIVRTSGAYLLKTVWFVQIDIKSLQSRYVMFDGIQVLHEMRDKAWCGCLLLTKGKQIRLTPLQVTDVLFRCYSSTADSWLWWYSNTTAQMKRDREEGMLHDKGPLRNALCPSVLWTMLLCSALLAVIKHGRGIFNSYLLAYSSSPG